MFSVEIAGIDVTDLLIGTPITVRHSSDHPFFSDTEISDVTFDLYSKDSEFDPLKPDNWFTENWDRIPNETEDDEWNNIAYRCPVRMKDLDTNGDVIVIFEGVIVKIIPDIESESAVIQATDASYQLRETEMQLSDFGVARYIAVGDPNRENVYQLPPTASPVFQQTVRARHSDAARTDNPNNELERVDSLESVDRDACKRLANHPSFIVHPNTPSIQSDRELDESSTISVSFREQHRWVRLDAIAKKIVESSDIISTLPVTESDRKDQDKPINVEIPDFYFRTAKMEYASRGRVGWHVELQGTEDSVETGIASKRWGWTGFVRDFVVNPDTGDTFFLYAHRRYSAFASIIHYNYSKDEYTRYTCIQFGGNYQSLWRLATSDFQRFYVLSTAVPTGDPGYEFGHNYNTATTLVSQANAAKPRILLWDYAERSDSDNGWSDAGYTGSHSQPPQLANYVEVTDDTGGGVGNWWADTRRFFGSFTHGTNHYIGYRYQTAAGHGIGIIRANDGTLAGARTVPVAARSGLGGDFCVDETDGHVYALTIIASGNLMIHRMTPAAGNFAQVANLSYDPSTDASIDSSDNLSISDAVYHNNKIYAVIQFRRGAGEERTPGANLVELTNSGGTWSINTLVRYSYYVSSASGGVAAGDKVYYFEGNTELYGNRGPRSGLTTSQRCPGSVMEVSSGMPRYNGLSWESAYRSEEDRVPEDKSDYGAHTGIIAPLRWDGEQIHMITGYGDVAKSTAFEDNLTEVYNEDGYLLEEPQEDIDNWQWLTLGRKQQLYLEKIETSDRVNAWSLLKKLAELANARLFYDADTLYMKHRAFFEIVIDNNRKRYIYDEDTAADITGHASIPEESFATVVRADNYTPDDTLMAIDIDPTYTQLHNQIRGNIVYTVRSALPQTSDERQILSQDKLSIKYIGRKPIDVDISLLTHHQFWWVKILSDRYIKQFSKLRYDIDMKLTWAPELRIGDILRVDVRHPVFQQDGYEYIRGFMSSHELDVLDAEIIEIEHMIGTDSDDAWTTSVVARTFVSESVIPADTAVLPMPSLPSVGALAFDDEIDDQVVHVGCEFVIQLPRATGGREPITYELTEIPDGFEFDVDTLRQLGIPTTAGTHNQMYTATDVEGTSETLEFDTTIEALPQWVGIGKVGDNFLMLDNPTNRARAHNAQYHRVADSDIALGSGIYVDADSDGSVFMALEGPNRRFRFWNANGVEQSSIHLPAGDWVACTMTTTRRYGLNTSGEHGLCIHGYSVSGNELVAERVLLDFDADYRSIAIKDGIVYVLVGGTGRIIAWNLSTKVLSTSHFKELPEGSTDYVSITISGNNLYGIRAESDKPEMVSL